MKKYLFFLFFILFMDNENPLFGQKDSTVVHKLFRITSKPANEYEGTYKSGKPYNGYFIAGNREFKWVDYYENGVIMFQYSNDYLANLEKYQHPIYDIKSTYKNGKIIDGEAYKIVDKGFVTKKIENGKIKTIFFDIFAMHYFNRVTLEKADNMIKISNLQEKNIETRYYFKNNLFVTEMVANGKTISYNEFIKFDLNNLPKNRNIYCVKKGDVIKCSASQKIDITEEEYEKIGDMKINAKMTEAMIIPFYDNLDDVFQYMADFLSQEESTYLMYMNDKEKEPSLLAFITTDNNGKIMKGIYFTESKVPFYEIYKDGKSIKKEQKNLKEFQKIAMEYLENRE